MTFLVFLFVFSNICLAFAHEKVAIDSSVTYKVRPESDSEDVQPQNDQVAESSHFNQGVVFTRQEEAADGRQTIDVSPLGQNVAQQGVHASEGLRHNSEIIQQTLGQGHSHPIYVQQYSQQPIQIFGAEASPLHQTRQDQDSVGYSTYVEHVSPKDEEEIQSALKEGSVGDIKRLVPKSGISFKIYHNDKSSNLNLENQKTELHQNALPALHYKAQVPTRQLNIQTVEHQQQTIGVEGLRHNYVNTKGGTQHHGFDNSLRLLQTVGKTDQQSANGQTVYFTQPAVSSQNTYLEVNEKVQAKPKYKATLEGNNYGKATSPTDLNSLSGSKGYGHGEFYHYQKQWSLDNKLEGAEHASKKVKPFATLQYEIDPVAQEEISKGLKNAQKQATSYANYNNYSKHKSVGETGKNANHLTTTHIAKPTPGHHTNTHHTRWPGNHILGESVKTGKNHIANHLGTSVYANSQHFKASQNDHHHATLSYSDSEAAKSIQQSLINHVEKNTQGETKNSQNFDHQKALEGSTSFDIKNAIDNTGNLIHQTNYLAPAAEIQNLVDIEKQQLAYIIPKIPSSTVLIDNGIHETPILEGHHAKEFGQAPQLSYHALSTPEVSGKLFHQPQNIFWTSEHVKQGNLNNLHQSIIRLPKEEVYQHVKASNLDLPTSAVSHISYQQHKQPYVLHYDVPYAKYPQEIHFQPKIKSALQNNQANHIKLTQPITVDWSLFKSAMPNLNINSLALKPELTKVKDTGKKIVPILVRKRKNRSNNKQEVGVIYGKVNTNRRPSKPNHRQEKNIRVNLLPEASNTVNQFEGKGERKNEFAVSASYKVDRSFKTPNSS